MQQIQIDHQITQKFNEAIRREWLETNGLGGWASSTISGAHTRRYHGLLVAAIRPPVERMVMLSKLDETIAVDDQRLEMSTNVYSGAVHPQGYRYLQDFSKNLFPVFTYEAAGVRLQKTIVAVNGENTTLILYEVSEASRAFTLVLQPFMAGRDYHSLTHANDQMTENSEFENDVFVARLYEALPDLFLSVPGATFEAWPNWYFNFEYLVEKARGQDFQEDLFTPGVFKSRLKAGDKLGVIASTQDPKDRDAFALFSQEKERRQKLFSILPVIDETTKTLGLAADQFIVQRNNDFKTIIAGYHWFTDWGRDTMIALPGLTLATGRFDDAKKIIRAFAQSISQGMLPNRFSDAGAAPEYNTVDATLWFFIAIYKYLKYTGDKAFIKNELLPVLEEIIDWHDRGTRYSIHVDDDGLLFAGEPGVQLTWMDAKIGDWVVTPRTGKAVEINALWCNALAILASLYKSVGQKASAERFALRAEQTKDRFRKEFWYEDGGYLYDYVNGEIRDTSIRPNQIFALSLPFPLLDGQQAIRVLETVTDKLYTPLGLRSLAPDDPHYRPVYRGNGSERDSAYHQGTVWAWLLGPWLTAQVGVYGREGKATARKCIQELMPHLEDAGIGTVSEIFDADWPHAPRGCIAQAWSVAEILRAYVEDLLEVDPGKSD
ncbi:MAG: amylo-alpha-1,6-glucosidase [Desulfobacterales bacterium]|jgi:predicted glycogen debranching enzyme